MGSLMGDARPKRMRGNPGIWAVQNRNGSWNVYTILPSTLAVNVSETEARQILEESSLAVVKP